MPDSSNAENSNAAASSPNRGSGHLFETSSVNEKEIAKFAAMAEDWWAPKGKFAPLHKLNPTRLRYIKDQIAMLKPVSAEGVGDLSGLKILDIGCGGGLVCEPLSRLGAKVTGLDATFESIEAAKIHRDQMGLEITYLHDTAEALAENQRETFDVVLALEIIEHVDDPAGFVKTCAKLVRPGGKLIMSTLNRTAKAYFMSILAAEYLLRWLPVGTHEFQKFLTPEEVSGFMLEAGLEPQAPDGLKYELLGQAWQLSSDASVNYFVTAQKMYKSST